MNQPIYKKELNSYLKQLKKNLLLSYSRQHTKSLMQMFEQNALMYFEENPTATFEDFKAQFRELEMLSPDIFEMAFTNSQNISMFSYKKRCLQVLAIGLIVCIFTLGGFYWKAYIKSINDDKVPPKESTIQYLD